MNALKKWFGQESPDTSEISEESDSTENENEEEKVERQERNKRRRRRNMENHKKLKAEVSIKASLTIGCHPIYEKDVENLRQKLGDLAKACTEAVKIFLRDFLQFNEEELKYMEIKDTKTSAKGESMIYVVFGSLENIKELHWRAAEIKDPSIMLRNYVPPQFWARYMHLSKSCSDYRKENPQMKTHMFWS